MEAVTVVARFRGAESGDDDFGDWSLTDNTIKHNEKHHEFNFDAVLNPSKSQAELYEAAGRKIINFFCDGYNGTIFAYGQSGSGKTFSMLGPETVTETLISKDVEITPDVEAMFGITPRATFHIFENIKEGELKGNKYDIRVSYIEVYNEMINDILPCPPGLNLKIREFPNQGMCVIGMLETAANTPEAVFEAISAGTANRMVCSTGQNARSSRSHTVFIISLTQTSLEGTVKKAKINLVDLAGSEKLSKTGAQGQALKEAKNINLSLTTLGRCIKALTAGSAEFVPYRESKLTLILKESLSGAAMTVLIVTGSMRKIHQEETIGTMQFAERAKMVKTSAKSNTKRSYEELDRFVTKLTDEVNALKKALKDGGGAIPEGLSSSGPVEETIVVEANINVASLMMSSVEMAELKVKYETLEESSARQIAELNHLIERAESKMGNPEFVGISEEIESFKERLNEAKEQIERLKEEKALNKQAYEDKIEKVESEIHEKSEKIKKRQEKVMKSKEDLIKIQKLIAHKDSEAFKLSQEIEGFVQTEHRMNSHIKELEKILAQEQHKHLEVAQTIEKFEDQAKEARHARRKTRKQLKAAEAESENLNQNIVLLETQEANNTEEIQKLKEACSELKDKKSHIKSKLEKLEIEGKKLKFEYKQHSKNLKNEKFELEQEIKDSQTEIENLSKSLKEQLSEEVKIEFINSHIKMHEEQLARVKEDFIQCQQYYNEISEAKVKTESESEILNKENHEFDGKIKELSEKTEKLTPLVEAEKSQKNVLHEELRIVEEKQQKVIEEEENKVKADMHLRMQAFIDQDNEVKKMLFRKQEDLQAFKNKAEAEIEAVKTEVITAKKENFEREIMVKNIMHEIQLKRVQNDEEIEDIKKTVQERIDEAHKLREMLEHQELKIQKNHQEIENLEKNIKEKVSERDTERKNSIIRATLMPKRNTIFNKSAATPSQVEINKFGGFSLKKTDSKFLNDAIKEAEELSKLSNSADLFKVSYEMQAIKTLYGDDDQSVPAKRYSKNVIVEEDEDGDE